MRLTTSRYVMNGCPKACASCGNPFPIHDNRTEAKVGKDGRLYCHDTGCENDALEALAIARRRQH